MGKMKIYTKTGDKGKTSLFRGTRVLKNSIRVEAYGTVDELNSIIGLSISQIKRSRIKKELSCIQRDLFEVGACLANPKRSSIDGLQKRVDYIEEYIDELTAKLPELRNFILAGGGSGAFLHVARTVCRRAERRIVALSRKESINPTILQYFNRLSDLLFTMARFVNYKEKKKEVVWKK